MDLAPGRPLYETRIVSPFGSFAPVERERRSENDIAGEGGRGGGKGWVDVILA